MEIILKYEINNMSDLSDYYNKTGNFIDDNIIIDLLKKEYSFNEKIAKKINSYVYEEYHSCYSDYLIYLKEVCILVQECIEIKKEGK